LSGIVVANDLERSTRRCELTFDERTTRNIAVHTAVRPCSARGLPSRIGHPTRWWALTPPFHPYRPQAEGGFLSVALSVDSSLNSCESSACRLAVSERAVLWSSDFPPPGNPTATAQRSTVADYSVVILQ